MRILLAIMAVASLTACRFNFKSVRGSGKVAKQERNISGFESVSLAGSMDLVLKQSDAYRVTVEADDNLMEYIETYKEGDELKLRIRNNVSIRNSTTMRVIVESPAYKNVRLAGSGDIRSDGVLNSPGRIGFSLAGSGDITAELDCPEVFLSVAGAGQTTLKGMTRKLDIDIAGSGDVNAAELKSEGAELSIAGSSNVSVYASRSLAVSVAGRGDVTYYGNPEITQHIAGSGNIRKGE